MNDLISRAGALDALGLAAWKHEGTDAYSQGMDAGARHQAKADYEAIRALPAASQPEAEPVASQISTIEAIYSNMPDIPELPDAYQPRNIAAELRVYHAARPTTPAPVVPAEGDLQEAIEAVLELVDCRCIPAFKERGLHDPQCNCDYAGEVQAIIAALRAQQPAAPVSGVTVREAGWQPIETAPKDGTAILASGLDHGKGPSRHYSVVEWMDFGCESGWYPDEDADPLIYLSHWMPLPEPPALSALEGE